MPIISGTNSPLFTTSTSIQNILDAVSQDIRLQLSSNAVPGQPILLDYLNRAQKELLRASKFEFLLSSPQRFITQLGVTDYWLGTPGQAPQGTVDTQLNLPDLRVIKDKSVFDRTNNVPLGHILDSPVLSKLEYPDATFRMFHPAMWRQSPTSPQVLNIYPAPDNQATYRPQPTPAICTTTVGGNLAARTYYVTLSYVDSTGAESSTPRVATVFVPTGSLLVVNPPLPGIIQSTTGVRYDRWNVYVGTSNSSFTQTLQNTNPLTITQGFVEPSTGLTTTGANAPSQNNVTAITGYIIEFQYYKQRLNINTSVNTAEIIQIPDDYTDVLIQLVLTYAYDFLKQPTESQKHYAMYREGLTQIIRDMNYTLRGVQGYIKPDGSTIGGQLPAVETIDLSTLLS